MKAESEYAIDYSAILGAYAVPEIKLESLAEKELSEAWIDSYYQQSPLTPSILSITLEDFTFLWDETYERVVVVFGVSSHNLQSTRRIRDKSRIAYYYRNFIRRYQRDTATDTGHFIAHSFGGGLDMNLFPQKRDVNRGYSPEGIIYRKMERSVLINPGSFLFSRPLYYDETWRPLYLEYGIQLPGNAPSIRIFTNT
jgi:hypothetical protein